MSYNITITLNKKNNSNVTSLNKCPLKAFLGLNTSNRIINDINEELFHGEGSFLKDPCIAEELNFLGIERDGNCNYKLTYNEFRVFVGIYLAKNERKYWNDVFYKCLSCVRDEVNSVEEYGNEKVITITYF